MKKLILLSLSFLMICLTTNVFAGEGPYMSINAGTSILSDSDWTDDGVPGTTLTLEYDLGFAGSLALGHAFSDSIRLEGELAYQTNDLDKVTQGGASLSMDGDTSVIAFMVNAYYDFANSGPVTPFISVGAGFAQWELNDFTVTGSSLTPISDDETVFAWQVGAGVAYELNKSTSLDLKYRYFATSDPEIQTANFECSSHNIYVGVRFGF